jgi:hypothetical protein
MKSKEELLDLPETTSEWERALIEVLADIRDELIKWRKAVASIPSDRQ